MSVQEKPRAPKTKEQYSRNVKVLKHQLQRLQDDIKLLQNKMSNAHSIDNDRILAMRFAKQCRVRKFTPEMIFRFADTSYQKEIDQTTFRLVLKSLGFNLSQDEVRKITILIDEDMSGKLTHQEFIEYLEAFNINTETPQRKTVKIKTIGIRNISDILGKDRMIDWEEFYKYMKERAPLIKEKELIKIFNKLDPNRTGKISLAELRKYLEKLIKEEEEGEKKAKKKVIEKKESKKEALGDSTLENQIHVLLKYRTIKHPLFHMREFKKVGEKLNDVPGLVLLFKSIDHNKIGSVLVVNIIAYYLEKKTEKQTYATVYELMNHKLYLQNMTVEQFLFSKGFRDTGYITQEQYCQLLKDQFQIESYHSKRMYQQIQDQLAGDKRVTITNVVAQFKQSQNKASNRPDPNNMVYLNFFGTKQNQFYKKGVGSIVFSPLLALRFCLHLESEILAKGKREWIDPEFGVTLEDKSGYLSVNGREVLDVDFGIDEDDLEWNRVQTLGMKEFYGNYGDKKAKLGKVSNPEFVSGLTMLPEYFSDALWAEPANLKSTIQRLTDQDLLTVFSGIYPKAFHHFSKYGIYVFRYFVQNRFVYVLVDDYIPTMTSKQIIFSSSGQSWVSLIQKGYAKLEGSYANMLHRQSRYEVMYQLSSVFPMVSRIPHQHSTTIQERNYKQIFWGEMLKTFDNSRKTLISCFNDKTKSFLKCQEKETQLLGEESVQIIYALEIDDKTKKKPEDGRKGKTHPTHRLLILKRTRNEEIKDKEWNESWSKDVVDNKYQKNIQKIKKVLKSRGEGQVLADLELNYVIIINYKRFRSMYDRIDYLQDLTNPKWNSKITLDRMLEEGGKYLSQFRLESRMKSRVILALLKRIEKPTTMRIVFGRRNQPPMVTKEETQDFIFAEIPEIQANIEYVLYIYCQEEITDFYLTLHLYTKDFKMWKSNGPANFHDSHKLQEICGEYKDADPKVKEYLEKKLFNVEPPKKGTGCCG